MSPNCILYILPLHSSSTIDCLSVWVPLPSFPLSFISLESLQQRQSLPLGHPHFILWLDKRNASSTCFFFSSLYTLSLAYTLFSANIVKEMFKIRSRKHSQPLPSAAPSAVPEKDLLDFSFLTAPTNIVESFSDDLLSQFEPKPDLKVTEPITQQLDIQQNVSALSEWGLWWCYTSKVNVRTMSSPRSLTMIQHQQAIKRLQPLRLNCLTSQLIFICSS